MKSNYFFSSSLEDRRYSLYSHPMNDRHYPYELVVVMPVYNEEKCIDFVVQSWFETLRKEGIEFRMIIINDGSLDNTQTILEKYSTNSQIDVISNPNRGHGPTILEGYWKALPLAPWVFQVDSDDEVRPRYFGELWKKRYEYDALFGIRQNRIQNLSHTIVTMFSRLTIHSLFGSGVIDVNVPFRLMKTFMLEHVLMNIPMNTFAPNVLISGAFARKTRRIFNCPVPWDGRKTGQSSFARWKLVKAVAISFKETVLYSIAIKKRIHEKRIH